ncbi:uncharacterized protein LOC101452571 isoform X2 [Ceratitis capitata]|uniref:(Mediterranean fruit fly) hypothetical protein n=1 Tax=Ceratitis capitata TaxID=7213 RepID=A0A811TX26_CERCA|nr:uncharacterized protein LOC101452571 isoform X2 [Ceratitis capitata]CAD6991352.1 unnamed protein product [Ceratitis capitata]
MSADRFNLSEFSEYLDDTDGHRLAQFLQKKSGTVRAGGRRIFDSEPERFSLNVQLKRLSSPPLLPTKDVGNQEACNERTSECNLLQLEVKQEAVDLLESGAAIAETCQGPQNGEALFEEPIVLVSFESRLENTNITTNRQTQLSPTMRPVLEHISEIHPKTPPNVQNVPESNQPEETAPKPICHEPNSPQRLQDNDDENRMRNSPFSPSFLQSSPGHSLRPLSPKSNVLRSGGVRSADKLRRQVLKRLSNIGNSGRRTLLKEFESTIGSSDFSPNICSTPMHQMPRENPKTPPPLENSPASSRTKENSEKIPHPELAQGAENNNIDQPLLRNMVETLEETLQKLKYFNNAPEKVSAVSESIQSANGLPNTQDLLLQARAETTTTNEITRSNVPATQDLLQEVQNVLQDFKKSHLQVPKIVIPVNQTINNAPPPTTKEINCNESIAGKNNSKIDQQTETDRTITAAIVQARSHATTDSIAENVKNCRSSHDFVNHATFTRTNTPNQIPPIESTRDRTLRSGHSLSQKAQLTFSKHNSKHTEKSSNQTIRDVFPSPKGITRKSESMYAKETSDIHNSLKGVSKQNISRTNRLTENFEVHEDKPTSSARSKISLNKTQKSNVSKNSIAHISKPSNLNEENVQAERAAATRNESRATVANNFNNSLVTEDEDEQYEAINKKQILRKSGPLNLATDKEKQTKRSRRTIKRTTRDRRPTTATISIITSDTEAESGPPPAHPLNLQRIQRVDNKRVQQSKRPLNKPPSTPKNGELFADELKMHLARLTNHEILDLRKRNSMGLLSATSLRKSLADTKLNVKDQLLIEDEIQLEILRRELLDSAEGLHDDVNEVMENDMICNDLPAAPDGFKDGATITTIGTNVHPTLNDLKCGVFHKSSLIDDNSIQHVSFRTPMENINSTQVRKSRRSKKVEQVPEVTRKYLELHKSFKKRRKSKSTKRSLYSQGFSDGEDESEIEPIPPPPIISPLKDWNIAPPPSPLISYSTLRDEVLPSPLLPISPPAPFIDDYPRTPPRNVSASTSKNTTVTPAACQTDDSAVFKKPTMPAPRAASKRKSSTKANHPPVTTAVADDASESQSLDDTNSLRRSKRGQVPRKLSFLCGTQRKISLFESLINGVKHTKTFHTRTKKRTAKKLSRNSNIPVPVASSSVTGVERKSKATTPAHSYLGDTNTTSGTICSVRTAYSSRLGAIEETETESEGYAGDMDNAVNLPQMPNDTDTTTRVTKSAQPKRRQGRPRKNTQVTTKRTQKEKEKQAIAEVQENATAEPLDQQYNELTSNRTGQLECSRINLPPPPSREKLNAIFDELKNAANDSSDSTTSAATSNTDAASTSSNATTNSGTRKLRVRLQRVKGTAAAVSSAATSSTSMCSSASTTTQTESGSRNELLTWLKNVTHLQSATNNDQVFKDMRPSAAGKLHFTDLEGIEYAFYDTKEKCSLGYLRFKPLQCKPSKRAKKYHLHFVVLAGTFEIGTENEIGTFNVGDMVAINIGCRYKITNLDNDVGIVMVFKK